MKEKPKKSKGDVVHKAAKIVLSGIPWVGGPVAELFNIVIAPPIAKRRDKWLESIYKGLKMLEEKVKGFSIESLAENEMFITTVMHATQVAIRSHRKEKLEALRNAVLNAASSNAPEEDIQLIFLNFVDALTPWHLRILKFFDNPKQWGQNHNISFPDRLFGALATVLEDAFLDLKEQRDFYDQIANDLYSRGLMNTESLHTTMATSGMFASRTTDMGKQFIKFITSPIE
ncbi:hypothetical protein ES703_113511 [subsurface metagenome]